MVSHVTSRLVQTTICFQTVRFLHRCIDVEYVLRVHTVVFKKKEEKKVRLGSSVIND